MTTTIDYAAHGRVMRRLLFGQILTRALCVMAELGLADELAAGPLTVPDLADRIDADPEALGRLLRALATFEVLTRQPTGEYGLTPTGEMLRGDVPGTALPTARLIPVVSGRAWEGLGDVVRSGESAFAKAFGSDFFTYLDENPGLRDIFDRSQEADLALDIESLVGSVPVSGDQVVVDVGGGDGALMSAIASAHRSIRGIIVDRPAALPAAARRLEAAGVSGRIALLGGDFFADLPADGDFYLLKHILHNLDDHDCGRLLRTCQRVMPARARLCVIDYVIDDRSGYPGSEDPAAEGPATEDRAAKTAALMDLYMMSLFGAAGERSFAGFNALLSTAGFAIDGVSRSDTGMCVITARKSRSPSSAI